jgi:hypothetical protein
MNARLHSVNPHTRSLLVSGRDSIYNVCQISTVKITGIHLVQENQHILGGVFVNVKKKICRIVIPQLRVFYPLLVKGYEGAF